MDEAGYQAGWGPFPGTWTNKLLLLWPRNRLATQARESFEERETLMGSSPRPETGWPIMVSLVGSLAETANMETVFEPGCTATRFCFC